MPQLTFPFYYVADFVSVMLAVAIILLILGVYILPRMVVLHSIRARQLYTRRTCKIIQMTCLASPLEQFQGFPWMIFVVNDSVLAITVVRLYSALACLVAIVFFSVVKITLIPGRWSLAFEVFYESLLGLTRENVRVGWPVPLLAAGLGGLLLLNLLGNLAYRFTVTSSLSVSLGLSFVV